MNLEKQVLSLLRKKSLSIPDLSEKLKAPVFEVKQLLKDLKLKGALLFNDEGLWGLHRDPPKVDHGSKFTYTSREDNTYLFGFIGDTHLGSKYERLDVLNDLYNIFELEGVDRVFHQGNWVEGECRLNMHDIKIHGIDDQLDYLVEIYPKKNFDTYAVTGDDHEGWWAHSLGIDIGRHLENLMHKEGRIEWHDLGYMESFIPLKNSNSGKKAMLLSMHPGGGSAYATSYRPQKIVESFSGGEKPNVLLIGHYHKLSYNLIRGVHTIQTGCTQDQTPFMRKKGIDAHVGGGICRLKQDPRTGSIYSCQVEFFQYFNKGYYNNRWNYRGLANLPERKIV
jgi:predicted phosphodiesterase